MDHRFIVGTGRLLSGGTPRLIAPSIGEAIFYAQAQRCLAVGPDISN